MISLEQRPMTAQDSRPHDEFQSRNKLKPLETEPRLNSLTQADSKNKDLSTQDHVATYPTARV
jgi:hypothetical protein